MAAPQQWYYRRGTARKGPVSSADLKKLAVSGELLPTDLLRGVGMTEWIPASKVKGLFQPVAKPKAEEELGLAVSTPPASQPKTSPPAPKPTAKPPQPKPATKPVQKAVQTAAPPLASDFSVTDNSNPYAQFGLNPTSSAPNDPFAAMTGASPNTTNNNFPAPFAAQGFGGGLPGNFDNLAALERQSQAIYREPPVEATPDPFATAQPTTRRRSSSSDQSGGMVAACLGGAMLFYIVVGIVFGCINAFIPLRILSYGFGAVIGKGAGALSGNLLRKAGYKNEVIALGFGGLGGTIILYLFLATMIWSYFNLITAPARMIKGMVEQHQRENPEQYQREMDEDGRSLVLRPDEPTPFSDPDYVPAAETVTSAEDENNSSTDEDEEIPTKAELAEEGLDEEEIEEAEETFETAKKEKGKFGNAEEELNRLIAKYPLGITFFQALSPSVVYVMLIDIPIYWLIMLVILIGGTAHATWMAALGSDPTQSGGF